MIVLGGVLNSNENWINNVTCDPTHAAMMVLDTTTFVWQNSTNPRPAAYTPSSQLTGFR